MEILDMFDTYNTESITEMIQLQEDKQLLLRWRSYTTSPNFTRMFHQAVVEHKLNKERDGRTYIDQFIKNCPANDDTETLCDTGMLFVRWCEEQNISPYTLLVEFYAVLGKRNPKKNCIMLQGASNAGKTYWMKALSPFPENTGQTVQSNDFAYQNCVDKDVIIIPELSLTKPEQVEELKKIMEGFNTVINVKNKPPQVLKRTPILLQCNQTPWSRNFGQERHTFLNRMYRHENLKPSEILRNNAKAAAGPDPRFFSHVFQHIRDVELELGQQWNYEPTDPYWQLLERGALDAVAKQHAALAYDTADFRETLLQRQCETDIDKMQQLVENGRDIINNCHFDRMATFSNFEKRSAITNWLLAISDKRCAHDVYWDLYDYNDQILFDATRKEPYDAQVDMDQFDMDSFRIAIANIEFVLRTMTDYPNEKPLNFSLEEDMKYKQKKVMEGIKKRLLEVVAEGTEVLQRDRLDDTMTHKYPEDFYPLAVSTPKKSHLIRRFDNVFPKYACLDVLRGQVQNVAVLSQELSRTDGIPESVGGIIAGTAQNPYRNEAVPYMAGDRFEERIWSPNKLVLLKTNLNVKPRTVAQTEITNVDGTEKLVDQKEEVERDFQQDGHMRKIKVQNMRPVHELQSDDGMSDSVCSPYSSEDSTPVKRKLGYSADMENSKYGFEAPKKKRRLRKRRKTGRKLRAAIKDLCCLSCESNTDDSEVYKDPYEATAGPSTSPRGTDSECQDSQEDLQMQNVAMLLDMGEEVPGMENLYYLDQDEIDYWLSYGLSGNQECALEVERYFPGLMSDPHSWTKEARFAKAREASALLKTLEIE